jgi:hypothetical protein
MDPHEEIFGKKAEDFKYSDDVCPNCNTRIDERGWCACDTIGGD